MTSARRLLASVDHLPYGARQRELASRARRLAGTPALPALLDELHAQGGFARKVALHLAYVGGEPAYVARCVSAEETQVVGAALGLAVRMGLAPDLLVEALPGLPTALRRKLYQEVRRRQATAVAEALLPAVRSRFGDQEAAVLLPVCAAGTVTAALPGLAYAVTGWGMIGRQHPAVFLDWLDAELDTTPTVGWQDLVQSTGVGLAVAARVAPARVLALLSRIVPHAALPRMLTPVWAPLARHDPAAVLALLVDPRRPGRDFPGGRKLWRALLALPDEDLVRLGRAMQGDVLADFLRQVPPSRRTALYTGVFGDESLNGLVPLGALDLLPRTARWAEAERLLAMRLVSDDPRYLGLEVTTRLPWPAARETLRAATRRSTADERGYGYFRLIAAAALSRDQETFAEMLGSLGRLTNEQDSVRESVFAGLTQAPSWLFRAAEAPLVLKLMTDAFEARDCSWNTQNHLRTLITRLVRHGALTSQPELVETGIAALGRLGGQRPWLDLSGLDRDLPRGGEHRVFEALRPRIAEDARHGRFEVALSLTDGLGRRAWAMPDLQEFVARARKAADDETVRRAVRLWLAPPVTRDERLAEVFHADRSTITIPEVLAGIGFRRTDLVDEVLTKPLHGRFLKRDTGFVPRFDRCFHHWLPRQCTAYAVRLGKVADQRAKQVWERVQAVAALGRVPGTAGRLRGYLSDGEVAVVEAALGALAWTDEPAEVLADLLAHADTDRARVAVYAAGRCARFVPPALLGETLATALHSRKVTSRKEAVRLLAAHHAPDVAGLLHSAWPNQHRDIRRAIVSAARWCLSDERVWELLESAATSEHAVATAVLGLSPHAIAAHHRPRYAGLVRTVADATDRETAHLGLNTLAKWARWDESGAATLVNRVCDLTSTAHWRVAANALVDICRATENPAPLVEVATTLLTAVEPAATADRDMPARQRLLALASTIRVVRRQFLGTPPAMAGAVADVLATEPTLRGAAVELAMAAVPLDPNEDDERALVRVAELAGDSVLAGRENALQQDIRVKAGRLPSSYLLDLATRLAAHEATPGAQLLALAIASGVGMGLGWAAPWRELVVGLREHPDLTVRTVALDTFTSDE